MSQLDLHFNGGLAGWLNEWKRTDSTIQFILLTKAWRVTEHMCRWRNFCLDIGLVFSNQKLYCSALFFWIFNIRFFYPILSSTFVLDIINFHDKEKNFIWQKLLIVRVEQKKNSIWIDVEAHEAHTHSLYLEHNHIDNKVYTTFNIFHGM